MTALGSGKIWILVPDWWRLKSSEPKAGDVTRKIGPLYFTFGWLFENFSSFLKICVQFQVFENLYSVKKQIIFVKKRKVSDEKVLAPIPILKLDLCFGSRYRNLDSVAHYSAPHFAIKVKLWNISGFWYDQTENRSIYR